MSASEALGQEADLLGTWQVSQQVDTLMGYAHVHAGAFVRDAGTSDDANVFSGQTTVQC